MATDKYLVIVVGDIEPELHKFETDEQRDNAAIEHKREEGDDDGIFKLDMVDGVPVMTTYSNGFFWDAENEYDDPDEYTFAYLTKCPKDDAQ
jgi:hypothetical protein